MDVLFISFNQIGCLEKRQTVTAHGTVLIAECTPIAQFLELSREALGNGYMVVAYLPATHEQLAEDLAALAASQPDRVCFVSCTCHDKAKIDIFAQKGLHLDGRCYWTKGCGGSTAMARVAQHVRETGELPRFGFQLDT